MRQYSVREKVGAVIYDLPRYARRMLPSRSSDWVYFCNRDERLTTRNGGVRCDWPGTSELHLSNVYPILGRQLMRRAFKDHPIKLLTQQSLTREPEVSFIIGHRGLQRLEHLLLTLQSIAGQEGVSVECIVVEQSREAEVECHLPSWVRYIHTPIPDPETPYCRSWAFNVGAREARSAYLILHDNDMLVPRDYSAQLLDRFKKGFNAINLKRFIFYLGEAHSKRVAADPDAILEMSPEVVVQNLEAGGSVAVSREGYFSIGGFDESFVGWGGEDNEFWERAQTLRAWPYGSLPIVHLWHPAQPGKLEETRSTAVLFEQRSAIPAEQRVNELIARNFGNPLYPPSVDRKVFG